MIRMTQFASFPFQGSILGPLLFLVYINDIHKSSDILQYILFADDTNLFLQHNNIEQLVQTATQELRKVYQWLNSNKLTLNVDKTSFMIFKTRGKNVNTPANVTINDKIIKQVKWTKFLGILIDEQMTWKTHINFITNKISTLSGIIARLRHYVGIKILRGIYFTLIYPYITYCNIVWGSNYSSRQNLHKVQKKFV